MALGKSRAQCGTTSVSELIDTAYPFEDNGVRCDVLYGPSTFVLPDCYLGVDYSNPA